MWFRKLKAKEEEQSLKQCFKQIGQFFLARKRPRNTNSKFAEKSFCCDLVCDGGFFAVLESRRIGRMDARNETGFHQKELCVSVCSFGCFLPASSGFGNQVSRRLELSTFAGQMFLVRNRR
jgi:hypothetical protein